MKPVAKKIIISSLIVIVVGGLGYVGYQAWVAYRTFNSFFGGSDDPRAGAQAIEKFPELNPYAEAKTNPFAEAKTNPFKDTYENPFE